MRQSNTSELVANLSGFLYAVSSFSGELRDYESYAYHIEISDESQPIGDLINEYFRGQFVFIFDPSENYESNIGELETRIQPFLIRNMNRIVDDYVADIRHYLSFRVMDMVQDIFDGNFLGLRVLEMQEIGEIDAKCSKFFCIQSHSRLLILQFIGRRLVTG